VYKGPGSGGAGEHAHRFFAEQKINHKIVPPTVQNKNHHFKFNDYFLKV
jgi:hypothetical protein